ncbi:MAG: LysM peptidoglycan-binding domain-containing protein, partial [Cyclobacteriaceae bacterium]
NGVEEIKVFEEGPTSSPVEISLPAFGGSLTIKVKKNSEQQREFELYGLSFESEETSGAIVHSLGISGAPYASLLIESLLEEQLIHLNPNLVILDLGTNDYIPGNRIPMDMEIKITDVIRKIRRAVPHADILLTTTQDMNRRGINMSAGRSLSLLIREIARKEDCAFFDWYLVCGGPKTMSYWVNQGLAQKDNIHLTHAGYTLKGRLLTTAFMNTVKKLEEEPGLQSLILNTDSIPLPLQTLRDSLRNVPAPPQNYYRPIASEVPSGKLITHTIKSGESLGSIAEKYGVSITSIRELNGIYGSKIIAGKTLKVIVKNNAPTSAVSKNGTPKDSQQLLKNTLPHKISSGETLFSIAEKYKVTVEELKKLNRLPNSRIVAGETLYIPLPSTEDKRNKS